MLVVRRPYSLNAGAGAVAKGCPTSPALGTLMIDMPLLHQLAHVLITFAAYLALPSPDYLKCAHPLAWTMANLAFSMLEFRDAYVASDQWDVAMRSMRWGIDWLLRAHLKASDNPADNVFVGQVWKLHVQVAAALENAPAQQKKGRLAISI